MNENPQKENGYIAIACELGEALARTNLSPYESRVLWCIFRKTYGYGKKEDWIALSQLEELTGMQRSHICRAKKKLLQRNIVTQTGNKIAFCKFYSRWKELPKQVTITRSGNKITQTGNRVVPKQAHTKVDITKVDIASTSQSPKTLQKHLVPLALWVITTKPILRTHEELQAYISRMIRASKALKDFPPMDIILAILYVLKESKELRYDPSLETVGKKITAVRTKTPSMDTKQRAQKILTTFEEQKDIILSSSSTLIHGATV